MRETKLDSTWWALRLTYGLIPIIAGVDKFTNLLVDWSGYLSPFATELLPVGATTFMYAVGIIEIIAGILVLSRFTRLGAFVVSAWLAAIALNLVTMGYYDIAVRDVGLAVGAFALAQMTEGRAHAGVPARRERRRAQIGGPVAAAG
jgi:uncharacterized membrane protein YphA (DoxX/SURF4 family)